MQTALNQSQCFHLQQSKCFCIFRHLPQSEDCSYQRCWDEKTRWAFSQVEIYHFQMNQREIILHTLMYRPSGSSWLNLFQRSTFHQMWTSAMALPSSKIPSTKPMIEQLLSSISNGGEGAHWEWVHSDISTWRSTSSLRKKVHRKSLKYEL